MIVVLVDNTGLLGFCNKIVTTYSGRRLPKWQVYCQNGRKGGYIEFFKKIRGVGSPPIATENEPSPPRFGCSSGQAAERQSVA